MRRNRQHCASPGADIEELRSDFVRPESEIATLRAHVHELEADRRELASIVEGSHDAIWSWRPDGTIVRWNPAAERLFGYSAQDIIGRSLLTLVPPERMARAIEAIHRLEKGQSFKQYETTRVRKDGSRVEVELTVSPLTDADGRIVGASTVCRNISERKRVEASLAQRVQALTTLHEFTEDLQIADSLGATYQAALDAISSALGCHRASILLFDAAGVMRFVAWRGLSDDYRKAIDGHSPWTPDTLSLRPLCIADIARSSEATAFKATNAAEGIAAMAFVPLIAKGRLIGKFMAYYDAPHDLSAEEVNLALTIARQLGSAITRQMAEAELRETEERFRLMSESAPVMIWMSNANGGCLHLNRMLRQFWGVEEADLSKFDWRSTVHPDDAPEIGRQMMQALATRSVAAVKGRYRDFRGRYRLLQTNAQPRFSGKGEFLGMIGVNVDVTDREEADRVLRESEQRFRLAVEAAPSGMVMTDKDGRIVLVNAHSERLFGYPRAELIGQPIEMLVPERFRGQHPTFRSAYQKDPSARPMGAGRDLFALRKDGTEVPVEIGLSPIETTEGVMSLAAVVDISSRKRAEAQRELLLAELNHRVKNTLAVVQSIAHQTFRGVGAAAPARRAFEGRLIALSRAHNLLTQTNWESASLHELASATLDSNNSNAGRITLAGPPILLAPKEALSMAMALHELYTNALKYGALSVDSGTIAVQWALSRDPDVRLHFTWHETGGPKVKPPKQKGFGSVLLTRMLAGDLDAEVQLNFDEAGFSCTIDAPLLSARAGSRYIEAPAPSPAGSLSPTARQRPA
ncbi:MAG TPA: PAS domain S-box protein [Pseudolabrys sp.]|nr:PAS domain S-box protein [Pseudolabrys sp.]